MVRKIVCGAAMVVGLFMAAPAGAQESPASVLPSTVVPTTVQVKGVQLPRTGSDLDAELMAGLGLTAAGAALALTARQRRRRVTANISV